MVKIIKTDWGIASRVGNKVYINKNIENYPTLYKALLEHEYKHTNSITLGDILIDINNDDLIGVKHEYYRFIIMNPKSWITFLPFTILNKKLHIDIAMIILWIFIGLIIFSIIYYT